MNLHRYEHKLLHYKRYTLILFLRIEPLKNCHICIIYYFFVQTLYFFLNTNSIELYYISAITNAPKRNK